METLRILVAEDHPLFRKGMISLLSSVPEFEISGDAKTGEEAVVRVEPVMRFNLTPTSLFFLKAYARSTKHRATP